MRSLFIDIIHVFVPKLCLGCRCILPTSLSQLCLECQAKLSLTHYEKFPDNPLLRLLNQRVGIEEANALCFFEKEGLMQKLIHLLKYKGQYRLGVFFGKILAERLTIHKRSDYTLVVPIPLYKKKKRIRGYNQVQGFAKALSQSLAISYNDTLLIRHKSTKTLVRMTQTQRWTQVRYAFQIRNPEVLLGQHVLLVDDVVTTGAALSAAVACLSKLEGIRVSVAAIAFAQPPLP